MHQHPRGPPASASPASSPWTNPTRTNNPREGYQNPRPRSQSEVSTNGEALGELDDGVERGRPSPQQPSDTLEDGKKKLNQIIQVGRVRGNLGQRLIDRQNYFYKAFLIIVQSRMELPPSYTKGMNSTKRISKWVSHKRSSKRTLC
jgi:autophagy-related protein 13